jgi:hypothetical protein
MGMLLVCVLLVTGLARGHVHVMTVIVTLGAICLTVAVLVYRAEVNEKEISIRYAPLYTKQTPLRDITNLIEGKTLILVTATSRIPLWGVSDEGRNTLFQILPSHLRFVSSQPERRKDPQASIRKHRRWAIVAGAGFLVSGVAVVPFFKGNALDGYWESVGQYLLLLCLLFFIALVFEAGFTWVLWSTKREIDKIENHPMHGRH